ncbi:hypothetical protein VNO78_08698 [Psophocarpus tetragonolobus]|uniref:Uncharacterized protein n=1 Tax=Psophocarpus tetragonolobus TaxID=3891 RepID=A0AAN9T5U0_PSOTE
MVGKRKRPARTSFSRADKGVKDGHRTWETLTLFPDPRKKKLSLLFFFFSIDNRIYFLKNKYISDDILNTKFHIAKWHPSIDQTKNIDKQLNYQRCRIHKAATVVVFRLQGSET